MGSNDFLEPRKGWIELITGCMFAGKTEEFIKRLRKHHFGKRKVVAFKPALDNRYSDHEVTSHSGQNFPSFPVKDAAEIQKIFEIENKKGKIDVVGIDEVQFLDENIIDVIEWLADHEVIVIVAGLDKDFKNEPFKNVEQLLYRAEYVDKQLARCAICGGIANRSQRLVDGQPAKASDPIILVSGAENYEARCRFHYVQPE